MGSLHRSYRGIVWICIFFLAGIVSCSKSGSDYQGELYIKLVDAPATYDAINLYIQEFAIHREGFEASLGWRVVSLATEGKFDVLSLRNGNDRTLVFSKVPVDKYDQIRLRFGYCSITVDGHDYTLVDSASNQTALIPYSFEIVENKQYSLTFDFEIDKSILRSGNQYNLTAQFRIQPTDLAGSIAGSVVDSIGHPIAASISTNTGLDSIVTTNDPSTGSFQLTDLPSKSDSSYTIFIMPDDPLTWRDAAVTGISVYSRQTTSVGAIVLHHQ
jgi:hypothetical protein